MQAFPLFDCFGRSDFAPRAAERNRVKGQLDGAVVEGEGYLGQIPFIEGIDVQRYRFSRGGFNIINPDRVERRRGRLYVKVPAYDLRFETASTNDYETGAVQNSIGTTWGMIVCEYE